MIAGDCRPAVPTLLERTDGQRLLYPGLTHSLHGEPESAKSLLMQAEAAVRINRGEAVLYLDFESDKESVVARLLEFGAHPQAILDHFHYVRPEVAPDSSPQEQAAWQAVLSVRYTLAVIDSVTEALAVLAWSSINNDDLAVWSRMVPRRIADATGAAVVLIDHVVKDRTTRNRWAIGGQTKMAGLTGASYSLEVHQALGRGMRGELRLRVGKDRPGRVRPHCGPYKERPHPGGGPDRHRLHRRSHGHHRLAAGKRGRRRPGRRLPPHQPDGAGEPPRRSAPGRVHEGRADQGGHRQEDLPPAGRRHPDRRRVPDRRTGQAVGSRVYTSVLQYREADDPLSDSYSDFADRPLRNMTSEPAGGGVG